MLAAREAEAAERMSRIKVAVDDEKQALLRDEKQALLRDEKASHQS